MRKREIHSICFLSLCLLSKRAKCSTTKADAVSPLDVLVTVFHRRVILLRDSNQTPRFLDLELQALQQAVQHPQCRRWDPEGICLSERLANDILKLDKVALFNILAHAGLEEALVQVNGDDLLDKLGGQSDPLGGGNGNDLVHDGADQLVNDVLRDAHAAGVHAQDSRHGVEGGIVQQLLPAVEGHVGVVVAVDGRAGIVACDEGLSGGGGDGLGNVGVFKGANERDVCASVS